MSEHPVRTRPSLPAPSESTTARREHVAMSGSPSPHATAPASKPAGGVARVDPEVS